MYKKLENYIFDDAVLKTAKQFIDKQGTVTTLEIKNKLRADHPTVHWSQIDISLCMDEIFQEQKILNLQYVDNGTYREYYTDSSASTSALASKSINSPWSSGVGVTNTPWPVALSPQAPHYKYKIDNMQFVNLDDAKEYVIKHGKPYYYSTSKDRFIRLDEMNDHHLFNSIMKQIKGIVEPLELQTYLNSQIVDEFLCRDLDE